MIFGRGGGGGVVNRVTKEAAFAPVREISLQGGAFGSKRFTTDFGQPLTATASFRLNGMVEQSNSFRQSVGLERYAASPTVTLAPNASTKIKLGYEYLHDTRVADRGMTSFEGRPADLDIRTFYGDPDNSHVRAAVNLASATVELTAASVALIAASAGPLSLAQPPRIGTLSRSAAPRVIADIHHRSVAIARPPFATYGMRSF